MNFTIEEIDMIFSKQLRNLPLNKRGDKNEWKRH